jgi:hypothetical protein
MRLLGSRRRYWASPKILRTREQGQIGAMRRARTLPQQPLVDQIIHAQALCPCTPNLKGGCTSNAAWQQRARPGSTARSGRPAREGCSHPQSSLLSAVSFQRSANGRPGRLAGRPLDVDRRAREGPRGRRGRTRSCGSRCPPPARRNDGSTRAGAADVGLGVAVSSCRHLQVSPPRLVVARARRGRRPARRSCDRSGPPACRSVGTSGGWTPHRRQGPGRSSAPGSPSLHPSPAVFDLHTLRRLALDDLLDHVGRHAARHVRGEESSAFSPDPRPSAPELLVALDQPAHLARRSIQPVVARRASPAHGQIDPVVLHPLQQVLRPATRSSHRSWVLLALGSSSPATACAGSPTWTLTPLTTRSRSASSHRHCLGRHQHLVEQPPRLADRVSRQVSSSRS